MSIPLPLATESVRCADFALEHRIDPGGTGLAPDLVVLVELAEPWPKPVGKHPELRSFVVAAQGHPENIRLLAAVPHDHERPRIVSFRPDGVGMVRIELPLSGDPEADVAAAVDPGGGVSVTGRPTTLLVCTQGSHDICCGETGAAFADAIEADRSDLEVFRVSHTGGHRFSPTAMTLPDGRMWAFLDTAVTCGIVDRELEAEVAASHCRGWWGVPTGPAQAAERAVFAREGWMVDDRERSVVVEDGDADGVVRLVTVQVGDDAPMRLSVRPGREVPTIACESPGGQPVKASREWDVAFVE